MKNPKKEQKLVSKEFLHYFGKCVLGFESLTLDYIGELSEEQFTDLQSYFAYLVVIEDARFTVTGKKKCPKWFEFKRKGKKMITPESDYESGDNDSTSQKPDLGTCANCEMPIQDFAIQGTRGNYCSTSCLAEAEAEATNGS